MKKIFYSLLIVSFVAHAQTPDWDDSAERVFNMQNLMTNRTEVIMVIADNVNATCEKESRNRGLGGFGYRMEACSFWSNKNGNYVCTIVTGKKTTLHNIGHEFTHCIKGNWHDEPSK
ncbi:MAG: hypothetical protein RLZZ196_1190 [Bacteroidota bacterium]|jgi:hypothetical protein